MCQGSDAGYTWLPGATTIFTSWDAKRPLCDPRISPSTGTMHAAHEQSTTTAIREFAGSRAQTLFSAYNTSTKLQTGPFPLLHSLSLLLHPSSRAPRPASTHILYCASIPSPSPCPPPCRKQGSKTWRTPSRTLTAVVLQQRLPR